MVATTPLPTDFAVAGEDLVLRPFSDTCEERQALMPLLGDEAVRRGSAGTDRPIAAGDVVAEQDHSVAEPARLPQGQ